VILHQRVTRAGETLVDAMVRVAFVSGGRARPIPKPLRLAMRADHDAAREAGTAVTES
jgi:acyl-CoA thioester hydrolase